MKNSLKFESLNDGLFQEHTLDDKQLAKVSGGRYNSNPTWVEYTTDCNCTDGYWKEDGVVTA